MSLLLHGPQIHTPPGTVNAGAVLLKDGLIHALDNPAALKKQATDILNFPANYHLVPGFIDMHVHGANGHDVMDATANALVMISQSLAKEGTTGFLATTMTANAAQIENTLMCVRDCMQTPASGASVLGVHLEGPFLSETKMGAQNPAHRISPNVELIQRWQKLAGDNIKLVTLAPEQMGSAELIHYLRQQNIIAAMGHTNATYAEAVAAIAAGCTHATHLFNAMRGIHQREPGTVTAALLAPEVMVELIVDGVHLHPAIVQLVLKTKGTDKIVLVTDAMRAKCLADGCYDLGGQTTEVRDGQVRLTDGTLAGSVLKMSSAIQNVLEFTGCDLTTAMQMVAENPAKALGLFHKKGSIEVGKDADVVVLDDALNVVLTVRGGEIIYQTSAVVSAI